MTENGFLHQRSKNFGKLPEELMHDPSISDGAKVLYAHMHWRYGSNRQNWEGQSSMAEMLNVTRGTIYNRTQELIKADWIVAVVRGKKRGQFQTNFYHVFETQEDCQEWKSHRVQPIVHGHVKRVVHGHVQPVVHNPDSYDPDSNDSIAPTGAPAPAKKQRKPNPVFDAFKTWKTNKGVPFADGVVVKLVSLNNGTSKKSPDCILSRPMTPDEIKAFPAWYARRMGQKNGRQMSLPSRPESFQQYAEEYLADLTRKATQAVKTMERAKDDSWLGYEPAEAIDPTNFLPLDQKGQWAGAAS